MSTVNEWIAREYFETLGYAVTQPCKYTTSRRRKRAEEEVDLMILNPTVREHNPPAAMVWDTPDLAHVARAVVGVRGWHTDRFGPALIARTPEMLRFAAAESARGCARRLGSDRVARVLCLARLPASRQLRKQALDLLRASGVDGIILFPTMLRRLIATVDRNCNYEKSDLLQILRILKSYDMIRDDQMELFDGKRRRRQS